MKVKSNRIEDIYNFYIVSLEEVYELKEAQILLKRMIAHFIESKPYRIPALDSEIRVSESTLLKIHFGVKDLLKFKPLEYITHSAVFYNHNFYVDENVLIPRPETEELVDFIWKSAASLPVNAHGLDVGTGSGCISIVLSKVVGLKMTACDISEAAIEVAQRNAFSNSANIEFIQIDFLKPDEWNKLPDSFDFIVSNPPYIPFRETDLMRSNVLDYEPHLALFVENEQPLIFYKTIKQFADIHLRAGGYLFLEVNEFYATHVVDLFDADYALSIIEKDLNGKPRFVIAKK